MSQNIQKLQYNLPQLAFTLRKTKVTALIWGRGTGKSTIIARRLIDVVTEMPRGLGAIVGQTYAQLKTRTLPGTLAGLEAHGYCNGLHYYVGKYPPDDWNWPKPYQQILDPTHCIFWWNGSVTVLISLDGGASSGRGLNLDYAIGDEAALFDHEKWLTDVDLCIRGGLYQVAEYPGANVRGRFFKDCPLHHSILLATSMPATTAGEWVLKYEELAISEPSKYTYIAANAFHNIVNLGRDYFTRMKASMPDFLYDIEVLNKRPGNITNGFYPKFSEATHTYEAYNNDYYMAMQPGTQPTCLGDADLNPDMPLHVTIDWGANINCMVVCQHYPNELRALKNFFVLSPKIIDDLIQLEFNPYYAPHKNRNKQLFLWYDPWGNSRVANARLTYAQQAVKILTEAGWDVQTMTRGLSNESHEVKFNLQAQLMQEADIRLPRLRFNKHNCKELIISMKRAPAKRGKTSAIQKDKSSETKKKANQEHATHFSDAYDVLVVGLFRRLLNNAVSHGIASRVV